MNAALKIRDFGDDFDPFTALETAGGEGGIIDPFPEFARLRRQSPIHAFDLRERFGATPDQTLSGVRGYSVLSYDLAEQILTDSATFSNKIYESNLGRVFGATITAMDAPDHTRYRRLFQRAFLPATLTQWSDRIVPGVINRLIDRFIDRGRADLVNEFAFHFPFDVIMELMALPPMDRGIFHKVAFGLTTVQFDFKHGMQATEILWDYLSALVTERRQNPPAGAEDLIHTLATAEIEGERLPEVVLVSFLRQLMNAGGDTSYHGFGNVLTALLSNPAQLEAVRRNRNLVTNAINEGLRWNSPVGAVSRTPTREVTFNDVTIAPGARISVVLPAANRDDTRFTDPDQFDVARNLQRHFAFGLGAHLCIGQHLARLEMITALNALLDRLPNLRLDPHEPPPVIWGLTMRGPKSVKVVFG